MNKSESIKNIAGALVKFQASVSKVGKESSNPFFKSKYASLSNILDTIQKPLSECGLAITQFPDGNALTTLIIHADSGEWNETAFLQTDMETNWGTLFFFINLQKDLLNATQKYLKGMELPLNIKSTLEKSGEVMQRLLNLQTVTLKK